MSIEVIIRKIGEREIEIDVGSQQATYKFRSQQQLKAYLKRAEVAMADAGNTIKYEGFTDSLSDLLKI